MHLVFVFVLVLASISFAFALRLSALSAGLSDKEMSPRIAVVTGANKGIGYEIARGLSLTPGIHVILTARKAALGQDAADRLKQEGGQVSFHQLDITDAQSIQTLRSHIESQYGGLDILVNNAGFAFKMAATEPFSLQAKETLKINYFGTLAISNALLPLIRANGRIVNVASQAGLISSLKSQALRDRFMADDLTEKQLSGLMKQFIDDAQSGQHQSRGWPSTTYGVSKIGVAMLTRITARDIGRLNSNPGVLVNCYCPGWCKTDMAGWDRAPRTAAQGADTGIYLATLPPGSSDLNGHFFYDRAQRSW
ncbi:unnamed protein product [Vitrella brassicaformis CCMP3155]|uniref:Carbonyl reductase n=2 Tax=Vitrella brassicaformis TaxID=1169539 RepID=A0A0G4EPR4_VITBC|nr:unnamed protein product [Vitrella brassicaformis CCMP3155]|eukprot:CEL99458.1 unnamed protein product [Vitrella brassicaformis CCMP3155]